MYLDFYNLKKEPFNVTPDPEFLFLSKSHREALGAIIYGVENRKGFISITGEVGVGKTTILRTYLEKVKRDKLKIACIYDANVSFKGLLKVIYQDLGIECETDDTHEMVSCLQQMLIEEYRKNSNVLLIIDEAQSMPLETLESIRILSNLETTTDKLIQIVFVGQPEFANILNQEGLRQLKQRIAIRSIIEPLSPEDSRAYIQHRLSRVENNGAQIFPRKTINLIVKRASGIPRTLNALCNNALVNGYACHQKPIGIKLVREVVSEFEGEEKSPFYDRKVIFFAIIIFFVGIIGTYIFMNMFAPDSEVNTTSQITRTGVSDNEDAQGRKNQAASESRTYKEQQIPGMHTADRAEHSTKKISQVPTEVVVPLATAASRESTNTQVKMDQTPVIKDSAQGVARQAASVFATIKEQKISINPVVEKTVFFNKMQVPVSTEIETPLTAAVPFITRVDKDVNINKDKNSNLDKHSGSTGITTKPEEATSNYQERLRAEMLALEERINIRLQSHPVDNTGQTDGKDDR